CTERAAAAPPMAHPRLPISRSAQPKTCAGQVRIGITHPCATAVMRSGREAPWVKAPITSEPPCTVAMLSVTSVVTTPTVRKATPSVWMPRPSIGLFPEGLPLRARPGGRNGAILAHRARHDKGRYHPRRPCRGGAHAHHLGPRARAGRARGRVPRRHYPQPPG